MLKISYCIDGYLWRKVKKENAQEKKYCFYNNNFNLLCIYDNGMLK